MTTTAEHELALIAEHVVRKHEPRPMGCACGAPIGDNIDYRWHLVNQSIAATVAEFKAKGVEW